MNQSLLSKSKRFLLIDCVEDDQRIVIFCSDLQLKLLVTSKRIGLDGRMLTCVFLFTEWRKKSTFRRMLHELKLTALALSF